MDYDIIISQKDLLNDFPIIREIIDKINPKDHLEKLIILWCINHYVPSKQLKKGEAFILFYENLIIEPENEIKNLFKYLNKRIEIDKISQILTVGTVTNFQNRDYNLDRNSLLFSWKDQFSIAEIQQTYNILSEFKLDGIYNKDGLPNKVNFFQ